MNETCDRCGPAVHAAYRVDRSGELYLCGHCTNRLGPPKAGTSGSFANSWSRYPQPNSFHAIGAGVPQDRPGTGSGLRGATNSKARKDYGWEPVHPSWREGFRTALG